MAKVKVYAVHGEVRRVFPTGSEVSDSLTRSWEEELVRVRADEIEDKEVLTDDDMLGNYLTARAVRVVNQFNASRRLGEEERVLVRSWVEEFEEDEEEFDGDEADDFMEEDEDEDDDEEEFDEFYAKTNEDDEDDEEDEG